MSSTASSTFFLAEAAILPGAPTTESTASSTVLVNRAAIPSMALRIGLAKMEMAREERKLLVVCWAERKAAVPMARAKNAGGREGGRSVSGRRSVNRSA